MKFGRKNFDPRSRPMMSNKKPLSQRQRDKLAREFPGLDTIPDFDGVGRVRVESLTLAVLRDTGDVHTDETFPDLHTKYYVVFGSTVKELRPNIHHGMGLFADQAPWTDWAGRNNGEQIYEIVLVGRPNYIVRCVDDGSFYPTWIVYKAKKFDLEGYFECEVKPPLGPSAPEESYEDLLLDPSYSGDDDGDPDEDAYGLGVWDGFYYPDDCDYLYEDDEGDEDEPT